MIYNDFRESGFRIFGLYPLIGGKCGCGDHLCKVAGKHPYSSSWQHSPDWSDDQLDVMRATGQLSTGYGVLCRGLIVVDIDARNGGVASWTKLADAVPGLSGAGLVVATGSGSGSKHLYFTAPNGVALVTHLPEYPGIDFKSSGYVVGPGSLHASGARYDVLTGDAYSIDCAPDALIDILKRPERHRSEYNGTVMDVSQDELAGMLSYYKNTDLDYEDWIRVGMALHSATNGGGLGLWQDWSATSPKHDDSAMAYKWHSFGKSSNPVTIGTLIFHAEQCGWVRPVFFNGDQPVDVAVDRDDGLPFDISGIDLNCPPGLVGVVTDWINDQCRRPRRKLAVAAALTAIGNIAGLRYTDDRDGATCNLFTFCVAGSRTGKEAVQQSVADLHRAAGIIAATHGSIKSEKEIVSNLVRHQSALYVVDEIGELLRKIKNAQDKGGAVYLDGVIGMLMSAYSKANKYMLLTGDRKEEVRESLLKERALLLKSDDDNPERLSEIDRALVSIDSGLERPFLSLHGYTIPETFDSMVDHKSATNGFIGRSLLFYERETVPKAKRGFKARVMPDPLKMTLMQLYMGGEFEVNSRARVQAFGKIIEIPSDLDACKMLDNTLDWIEDAAENQKGRSGLEALVLGSYELVAKVSLILAIGEGVRTAEHVRWAFALVKRDIEEKIALVVSNDRAKDAPAMALTARITGLISGDDGETLGVIVNKCRGYRREDIEKALKTMVKNGGATEESKVHPKSKKTVARYKKA